MPLCFCNSIDVTEPTATLMMLRTGGGDCPRNRAAACVVGFLIDMTSMTFSVAAETSHAFATDCEKFEGVSGRRKKVRAHYTHF